MSPRKKQKKIIIFDLKLEIKVIIMRNQHVNCIKEC